MKDKPRSGRLPDVSEEKLLDVRKELSENPSGWKVKQIMNIRSENIWNKIKMLLELNIYPKDHQGSALLKNAGGKEKMIFRCIAYNTHRLTNLIIIFHGFY